MDVLNYLQELIKINVAVGLLVLFSVTFIAERIIRRVLNRAFEKSSRILKVDVTNYMIIKHLVSFLIYVFAIGVAVSFFPALRGITVSIFASAGVLAVVIGFASQQAFSNIISGVFIAIFRPFRVGDTIKFSDKSGVVEDITLRHTIIRNFENRRFVIPNSKISEETIENFHLVESKTCRLVEFSISYDSDLDKAMKIMQKESEKHPNCIDTRTDDEKSENKPIVNVRLIGFSDSSVNLRAWVWAEDPGSAFRMGTDLNKSIKEKFDKAGIEIPYPHRTIVYKKDIKKIKSDSK